MDEDQQLLATEYDEDGKSWQESVGSSWWKPIPDQSYRVIIQTDPRFEEDKFRGKSRWTWHDIVVDGVECSYAPGTLFLRTVKGIMDKNKVKFPLSLTVVKRGSGPTGTRWEMAIISG